MSHPLIRSLSFLVCLLAVLALGSQAHATLLCSGSAITPFGSLTLADPAGNGSEPSLVHPDLAYLSAGPDDFLAGETARGDSFADRRDQVGLPAARHADDLDSLAPDLTGKGLLRNVVDFGLYFLARISQITNRNQPANCPNTLDFLAEVPVGVLAGSHRLARPPLTARLAGTNEVRSITPYHSGLFRPPRHPSFVIVSSRPLRFRPHEERAGCLWQPCSWPDPFRWPPAVLRPGPSHHHEPS